MSSAARLWLAVAPAALVAGGLALWIILTSDHQDLPRLRATLVLVTGWSFIAAGLIARVRRPLNRTGLLLIAVGFWLLAGSLSAANQSLLWTIGLAIGPVTAAFLVHLLLAYPSGRLVSRWDRAVVTTGYVLTALASLPVLLVDREPIGGCTGCPESAFLVKESDTAAAFFTVVVETLAAAFLLTVVATLVRRWRRSSPAARRLLTPVMLAGGATLVFLAVHVAVMSVLPTLSQLADWAAAFMLLGVPFLFLLGLLKSRLARADISRALAEEPAGGAQQRVRELLHDPTAELLYACAEPSRGYVDAYGRSREPVAEPGRAVTPIEREGRALAAIVHDEALLDEPELLEQVAATVGLEVERDQNLFALQASERRSRALLEAIPDKMFRVSRDGIILDVQESKSMPSLGVQVGSSVYDGPIPREHIERVMEAGCRALETGELQTLEWNVEIAGDISYAEGRFMPSGEDEFYVVIRDVSDRKRQEIQQAALHRVALAVASEARPEQIFDLVSEEIARVLGAHTTNLVRFEPGLEEGLIVGGWRKPGARAFPIGDRFPLEGTASEAAMKTGRPVRRELDDGEVAAWVSDEMHSLDIHSLVAAPITLTGRPWGAAVATLTAPHSFPPGAEERLSGFARLVSLALANEEAREELAASRARLVSAGDKERRRLERNLHDGAQQRLVSVSISLRLAQAKLPADPEAGAELLAAASAELAVALEELRELARGIHPAVLTERGLGPALASLAGRASVPVELESLPEERLPDQVEAAAYYVVSEALANVAKYADASSVSVRVAQEDGLAVVEVVDDGVGGAEPERGSGLRGLADRVESLDGRLRIESPPGEGTTIRAEIPSSRQRAETPAGRMPAGIHP
jgi:signal transduction histidine kinase/PAS domain-containing protein